MTLSRVKKNAPLLKILARAKPATAKAIIKTADKGFIHSISECCLNILRGNIKLTPSQKKKLTRHKLIIRKLASKPKSIKTKKALLQKGGFIRPLLDALGTILGLNG